MPGRALLAAILVLGLVVATGGCSGATSTGSPSASPAASDIPPSGGQGDAVAIARAYVAALADGDAATAETMEAGRMRQAAPASVLEQLWNQIVSQFGKLQGVGDVAVQEQAPYRVATVQAQFATAIVPLEVAIDEGGLVAGFHLGQPVPAGSVAPATPAASASASPAAYVDRSAFTEKEVTVGAAPWTLPGTLSMPTGAGPFAAAVLVAGSGPQDRDETIGPNAPLRDLAWGLASKGIAVLRYDKRTKTYARTLAGIAGTITVKEETMADAIAAADLLRAAPAVDSDRVFLVGHSLGGFLAPRIAAAAQGRLAGIALLEANARPLQRMIVDQLTYLASDAGGADPQAKAMLETLRAQVARVESPDLSAATPASDLPLGIPAGYWLDLRTYDPVAVAAGLDIPIFISQGGRDYQVPPTELEAWRAGVGGRENVTIREYPSLDHLLLEGTGPSRPAEYLVPGHVSGQLVEDLAAWIRAG